MILPRREDAPHKFQMYRLLMAILNTPSVAKHLVFKGGTCAVLRGWLNRFSIDLDFDILDKFPPPSLRTKIHQLVQKLGFTVKDESQHHLQFFLKYPSPPLTRNTLKLEINDEVSQYNRHEIASLAELNLMAQTQTQATMVANKLVVAMNRYQDHGSIAGRDYYDLHHFLTLGYEIDQDIVVERMKQPFKNYINSLILFINSTVTDRDLYEDLNPLLPTNILKKSVASLRPELIMLLKGLV